MYNVLYTVSTQQYISTVIQYARSGHIIATCFDCKRSKHVAVMWPKCIYFITVMIYCCVLTVYNTIHKFYNNGHLCIAVIGSFLKKKLAWMRHIPAQYSITKNIGSTVCYVHKILPSVALNCLQTLISSLM